MSLFEKSRRYLIPIYQRPYVWSEENQWKPLWADIANKADSLFEKDPKEKAQIRKHFLGAIVLFFYQPSKFNPSIPADEIIDGQQRISTIQIMLYALRDFLKKFPVSNYPAKLRILTSNELAVEPKENYKVWPRLSDRTTFEKIYTAESPEALEKLFPKEHFYRSKYFKPRHKLVDAYLYFYRQIISYVNQNNNGNDIKLVAPLSDVQQKRLTDLIDAITKYMEIVVIELEEKDDPQVIFEALNDHREPLLPSDLIRNLVFLNVQSSGKPVEAIHQKYWADYDNKEQGSGNFWSTAESRGRRNNQRFDIFILYYLTIKAIDTKSDISLTNLYQEFREWWNSSAAPRDVEVELQELNRFSELFKKLYNHQKDSRIGDFTRRLRELDTTTIYPLVLYLLSQDDSVLPDAEIIKIFCDLESFLVRRAVCGLTPKNYNRFFLSLLKNISGEKQITYIWVHDYLIKQTEDTSKWPTDEDFMKAWLDRPIYRSGPNLPRMVLKAIDQSLATSKRISVKIDGEVSVEHVMPQNMDAQDWKIKPSDFTDELERIKAIENRRKVIQTMGNLTLVTTPLNSSMQDSAFRSKRIDILDNNSIQLNSYFLDFKDVEHIDIWAEEDINKRAKLLFEIAKTIWLR